MRGINLIASKTSGVFTYYMYNGHGDVVQLTDVNGYLPRVVRTYNYDAFGNGGQGMGDPNPFGYCGEYFDKETGTVYLRNRYYSPKLGRFTQEDPIVDGLNYYTYANCNPILFIDPWGLASWILYDPNFAYGDDKGTNPKVFVNEMEKQLKDLYGTEVNIIQTKGWKAEKFSNWWNELFGTIDAIIILTHGEPDKLLLDRKQFTNSKEPSNYILSADQVSNLDPKRMDMLLLLGCNTGHLNIMNNMGMAFASKVGEDGRVIAPDGTVDYNYSSWYGFFPSHPTISVKNDSQFKNFLPTENEKRKPTGMVVFYQKNGVVHNCAILGSTSSQGGAYSPSDLVRYLYNGVRKYYNQ